jgi:DNA invertase Pin-like site-specific DNA recombinase
LRELHAKGVDLFLHQQGLDTSTPAGRAMFQMMGVFAEFERAMIRERVISTPALASKASGLAGDGSRILTRARLRRFGAHAPLATAFGGLPVTLG